jgi:hypothetical protein
MTSNEYQAVIVCLDDAIKVQSTSPDRVGDVSFHADLIRTRSKAVQEMLKARAREQAGAPEPVPVESVPKASHPFLPAWRDRGAAGIHQRQLT